MRAEAARRPRIYTTGGVPVVEGRSGCSERGEAGYRIEQVRVMAAVRGVVEVLAPQREPQRTGEPPRVVTQSARIGGLATIRGGVEHPADGREQVQAMFAEMLKEFGTVDILVNNAGLQRDSRFQDMTLEQWNYVLSVNLTGQFLCAREAIRLFLKQGVIQGRSRAAGKIICMSSVHEVIPWGGHANYAASKGGIMLLMKSIAQEFAPSKIRINSIGPGAIKTPINHAAWATPEWAAS